MAEETTSTLAGFFKTRYLDKMEDLVPDHSDFAEAIPFGGPRLGKEIKFPVRVKRAQGFTVSSGGTAYSLNDAVPGQTLDAVGTTSSYTMREEIAYDVAAAATSNEEAFGDAFDQVVADMVNTMGFHRELAIVYGASSIGATSTAGAASSPQTFTLTTASSAIGLWLQLVGAPLDAYDPTLTTQRNTNAQIVLTNAELDTDGQTVVITVTGNTTDLDAILVSDVFVPRGWVGNTFSGVDKIITNTGTLFGISASTYPLWKGNVIDCSGGQLTMLRSLRGISQAVQRGGRKGRTWKLMCSYPTWNDSNNNLSALRRFASSTKGSIDTGTEGVITYYGPGIRIDMMASALVKNGEAFAGEWDRALKRLGASDITFMLPGSTPENAKFFREMENKAGYEIRGYWQQLVMPLRPASLVKFTGITNSAG